MKGIIMEVHEHKLIVMTKDGEFLEINRPDRPIEIGEEIIVNNRRNTRHIYQRFVAAAAVFILLLTGSYGAYGYYMPYGHVNVDINPSVEITYNLYKRVIKIEGLNEDGHQVVGHIRDYKNQRIDTVINRVVDEAVEENYIKNDGEDFVLVTVTELGKQIDDEEISTAVDHHMKETKTKAEVMVIANDKETYNLAKEVKTSPGKKALIREIMKNDKSVDEKVLLDKPVKEIAHFIKEQRVKATSKEDPNGAKGQQKQGKRDHKIKTNEKFNKKDHKAVEMTNDDLKEKEIGVNMDDRTDKKDSNEGIKSQGKPKEKQIKAVEKNNKKKNKTLNERDEDNEDEEDNENEGANHEKEKSKENKNIKEKQEDTKGHSKNGENKNKDKDKEKK